MAAAGKGSMKWRLFVVFWGPEKVGSHVALAVLYPVSCFLFQIEIG
jgi:hypothetical protein